MVDERSEICGCYMGIPGNDVGIRTDVMDACPKAEGMMMLVRSMAPEVIAVDELGRYEDIHAIETVLYSGCRLLATVHGSELSDIQSKPLFQRLMTERVFERYVILGNGFQDGYKRQAQDWPGSRERNRRKKAGRRKRTRWYFSGFLIWREAVSACIP